MTRNAADVKGAAVALWERVHRSVPPREWPMVTRLTSGPEVAKLPPGYCAWAVGAWPDPEPLTGGRSVVVMPELVPDAPLPVRRRYLARVVANGCGQCPLCSGVAGIVGNDPEIGYRAGYYRLPVTVQTRHAVGCPTEFEVSERGWFVPFRDVAE